MCYNKLTGDESGCNLNLKIGGYKMSVRLNDDPEIVKTVREGLKRRGGYCPCRLESTEDTKCMCKEFRDQIADPDYVGYCHCMLYYKDNN